VQTDAPEPVAAARALWARGERESARRALARALADGGAPPAVRQAAFAFAPAFWTPLEGRSVRLVRRGPADRELVRAAWADRAFMDRFHRFAPPLPADDAALDAVLRREEAATLLDGRNLHWTVRTRDTERGAGMVSLAEISLRHGRAEFLVGMRGGSARMALEASLLALEFAFAALRLHKVTSTVYAGNERALTPTLGLGFRLEGRLRDHARDPRTGQWLDLHLSALFEPDFRSPANAARALRVLGRPLRGEAGPPA